MTAFIVPATAFLVAAALAPSALAQVTVRRVPPFQCFGPVLSHLVMVDDLASPLPPYLYLNFQATGTNGVTK